MNQRNPYIDELLSAYVDGQTTPDESARVERLLAEHDEHRRTVDEMRSLGRDIKSLARHQLDDQFRHRVLQKATRRQATTASPAPSPATSVTEPANTSPFIRAALVTAALAATVLVALFVARQFPSDSSPMLADANSPVTPQVTSPHSDTHSSITDSGRSVPNDAMPIAPEPSPEPPAGDATVAKSGTQSSGDLPPSPAGDLAVAAMPPDSPDRHTGPDSHRTDEPNKVHSPNPNAANPRATDVAAAPQPNGKSAAAEHHSSGGLLLVIDVKLTPLGREKKSFDKALTDHGIAFHSSIQANSKLEKALLASRFVAADKPAKENEPPSVEPPQQQLVYVISAVGQVDHLWRSMLERTDCFAGVSLGVAMQPTDLAVFRRLHHAAEEQWSGTASKSANRRMAAFRLVLSSSWRGAVGSAVDGIMGLVPQQPVSGQASERTGSAPPTGGAPQSKRWLDENLRAEVLFVVK